MLQMKMQVSRLRNRKRIEMKKRKKRTKNKKRTLHDAESIEKKKNYIVLSRSAKVKYKN